MNNYYVISKEPNVIWMSGSKIEDRIDVTPFKSEHIENEKILENIDITTINEALRNKRDLTGGATPLGANYLNEGIKFIRTQNIQRNSIDLSDVVYISKKDNEKLSRSKLEEDDVLLTITGADFGRIATVRRNHLPANISQHSVRMHFKENIDPYFVSTYLNCKYGQSQIYKFSVGATRPAIDYAAIRKIKIPTPSPIITKYIGDKVRGAEELSEEAKKIEILLNNEFSNLFSINIETTNAWYISPEKLVDRIDSEYNHTFFYELEDKLSSKGFKIYRFGELIKTKMSEPQTDSSDFISEGIPILRISDIYEDFIDFENCAKIPEEVYYKLKDFQLIPKDIIFGLSGTVGRAIVVPNEIPNKAITNRRIAKITLHQPALSYYVARFLNSKFGKVQLLRETAGGVQKNLRLEDISKLLIPIPNSDIVNRTNDLMEKKARYLNQSRKLIQQAKLDVENLIEGNFDMSKLNA